MVTEPIQVRLPEWAQTKTKLLAEEKGLPIATMVKEIVCERFKK